MIEKVEIYRQEMQQKLQKSHDGSASSTRRVISLLFITMIYFLTRETAASLLYAAVPQTTDTLVPLGIMGSQIKGLLNALKPSQHYRIEGVRGTPWYPIMPGDASLSDSGSTY